MTIDLSHNLAYFGVGVVKIIFQEKYASYSYDFFSKVLKDIIVQYGEF